MSKPESKSRPLSLSRRQFIYTASLAAGGMTLAAHGAVTPKFKSPNEKLAVGIIGTGGKGEVDSAGMSGENIVALCDVDARTLARAAQKWPNAKTYRDYREMIQKEKSLDAVTVTIPDHQHYAATLTAMRAGLGVYCQKPLTHAISEARALATTAREMKLPTQMGNQGHSSEDIRRLCEMIWSGAIGQIREVHCWTNRPIWPQGLDRPQATDPIPETLAWDNWLGPAEPRPFVEYWRTPESMDVRRRVPVYHPFCWRGFWDFGCGALGDMACHVMDGAYWALKLGSPTSVEVVESSPIKADMAPQWSVLKFEFPQRGDLPPCTLTWHDGGKLPERPAEMEAERFGSSGTIFIGEKGKMMCGEYCDHPRLLPESSMLDYKRPAPTIPRVPNDDPYQDFIRACKGGPAACSNFEISGPFTEMVLLGNLALRLGGKIEWDAKAMQAKNRPEADKLIRPTYRKGWDVTAA